MSEGMKTEGEEGIRVKGGTKEGSKTEKRRKGRIRRDLGGKELIYGFMVW